MLGPNRWFCAVVAVALVATMAGMPETSWAQYPDNSDDLPGLMSGGEVLLYALGVAAVVTVVFLIARRGEADEPEKAEEGDSEGDEEGKGEDWEGSLVPSPAPRFRTASVSHEDVSSPVDAQEHALELIVGVAPGSGESQARVVVGMAVSF